ncbi:MAG: sodium-dependent bicarbonate transport family permease [Phycisphaerae bacterium]
MFELELIVQNLLQPPILFFLLGLIAVWTLSDLEIPQPIPKVLSLALLLTIGFKGGVQLAAGGLNAAALLSLGLAIAIAIVTPLYAYALLRIKLNVHDAAAVAATYGSVSAITFITAISFLDKLGVAYGGHMIAAMALMESPAIIIAVLLVQLSNRKDGERNENASIAALIRHSLFNSSVLLLLGSAAIGVATGVRGGEALKPLTKDLFPVFLTFFLLDMGIVAGKRLRDLWTAGTFVVASGVWLPILNAVLALAICYACGVDRGDAFLLVVLAASASYIAVPAAMRLAIPEARPSLYVSMALAITFPFNITLGIPTYYWCISLLWGDA